MDPEYFVEIVPSAKAQMAELVRYIARTLMAPGTAADILALLDREIRSLDRFPNRCALTEEEPWHSLGVRRMAVKNFLVYYRVDDASRTVQVLAVLSGRRDQLSALARIGRE